MIPTIPSLLVGLVVHPVAPQPEPGWKNNLGELPAMTIPVRRSATLASIAVAPDGKSVACSGHMGVMVLSFPDGKVLHTFEVTRDEFCGHVAFTPDGNRLIGASYGLRVWDLETGKLIVSEKWDWERKRPSGPAFDATGQPLRPVVEPPPRPEVSPDGKRLYVGGSENDFRVIDTATGKELRRERFLGRPASSFAPSPDGKALAVTTRDALIIFRTDTFAELERVDLPKAGLGRDGYCVRFASGSDRLFVLGPSGERGSAEIRVWDRDKGRFTLTLPPVWPSDYFEAVGAGVAMLGDSQYALVSQNGTATIAGLYDLTDGRYLGFTGKKGLHLSPLVPTPDGKHLIGGLMSDNLVVIKVEDVLKLVPKADPAKKP